MHVDLEKILQLALPSGNACQAQEPNQSHVLNALKNKNSRTEQNKTKHSKT